MNTTIKLIITLSVVAFLSASTVFASNMMNTEKVEQSVKTKPKKTKKGNKPYFCSPYPYCTKEKL